MKIKRISIKNFIGIEEMNLEPGKINLISGFNGKGKTTILEALEKVFTNNDRRPRVIRDGADKSVIFVETDDGYSLRRSVTEKSNSLTVTKDGFAAKAPQRFLQGLIGQFSFNPVDFLTKSEKEQTAILLAAAPLTVTMEDVEQWTGERPPVDTGQHGLQVCKDLHSMYYEKRRDQNATVKAIKGEVEAIQVPDGFDPEVYRGIKLRDLYDEMEDARGNNSLIELAKVSLDKVQADREKTISLAEAERINIDEREKTAKEKARREGEAKIAEIKAKITELQAQQVVAETAMVDKIAVISAKKTELLDAVNAKEKAELEATHAVEVSATTVLKEKQPIDTAPMEARVQEFEEKQHLVKDFDRRLAAVGRLEDAERTAKHLDQVVKTLAVKPGELITQANLPVQGLGIDDKGNVTINGRPIKSLSTAEQIKVSLEIAKATAGQLQLICIDGFEAIVGEAREELLRQIAQDEYQYFITEASAHEMRVCVG